MNPAGSKLGARVAEALKPPELSPQSRCAGGQWVPSSCSVETLSQLAVFEDGGGAVVAAETLLAGKQLRLRGRWGS